MDHNALYYLFSTTAQSLASAVGFLAAFVLLRLQDWDEKVSKAHLVWNICAADDPLLADIYIACERGDRTRLDELWAKGTSRPLRVIGEYSGVDLWGACAVLISILPRRRALIANLWRSLSIAGATVIGSLAFIPFSRIVAASPWAAWVMVALVVLAAVWSGLSFFRLVAMALHIDKPKHT